MFLRKSFFCASYDVDYANVRELIVVVVVVVRVVKVWTLQMDVAQAGLFLVASGLDGIITRTFQGCRSSSGSWEGSSSDWPL